MRIWLRHIVALVLVPVVALLAIGAARQAAAFDYVENGGFEFGDASWIVAPSVDLDTVGDEVVDVREGARSGRVALRGGSSTFSIRQPARTGAPAGVYHFAVWIRTTSRSTEVYAEVTDSVTLNTVKLPAVPEQEVWIRLAADVDVTSSSEMMVIIGGHGDPGDVIYVDGVQFTGAPPVTATATTIPGAPTAVTARQTPTSPTKTPQPTGTPLSTDTPVPESISADLRNGGFESTGDDGTPTDWRGYGGTISTTVANAHSGSHAARWQSDTDSTKWLYEIVSVSGGVWYAFGAWILDDDQGVASASLRISWYGSNDGSGRALATADSLTSVTSPSGEYQHLSTGSVAAPTDARSARLRVLLAPMSAAPAAIFVDDASFGQAEPPADGGTAIPGTDEAPAVTRLVLGEERAPRDEQSQAVQATGRPATSQATLLLNEVMYDPSGDDDAEWVELYNASGRQISLAGWSLADAVSVETLPEVTVGARAFVVIAASDSFRNRFPGHEGALVVIGGHIGNGLGNAGDRLVLRDPSRAVVDAISWGDDTSVLRPSIATVPSGHSIERRLPGADNDSAADWVDNMRPSPGAALEAARIGPNIRSPSGAAAPLDPSGEMSLWWLPWGVAGVSALGLLSVLSWRAAPTVSQRLRRQP